MPEAPPAPVGAELVAWLRTQYRDEECDARAAMQFTTGDWDLVCKCTIDLHVREPEHTWDGVMSTDSDPGVADHIVAQRPIKVLRNIAAKREILDLWESVRRDPEASYFATEALDQVVRILAKAHQAQGEDVVLAGELVRKELPR